MPTITQLEYILAVDREKHFGKAARSCHVSQPSLSAQIQKLEDELDVVIFDRSKKPVLVTETGREILDQAKLIIKEHRKLSAIACLGKLEPKGAFHLAVIPTLAPYLIPLFVADFSNRFPLVRLTINEHKTDDIIRLLVNDELDAGLLVSPLEDDRLIERHLFFERFFGFISPGHDLLEQNTLSESDLDINSLWILEEGHCFRNQVLKVCSMESTGTVLPNVEFASGNLETLKTLVRRQMGYTLLPELALAELSEADRAKYVRSFEKPVPTREVSLVHSRSFLKANIVGAMEQTILENLPAEIRSLKRKDLEVVGIY